MIDPSTGAVVFEEGGPSIGPATKLRDFASAPDGEGPDLVPQMRTKTLPGMVAGGTTFTAWLDFLGDDLTALRLMATGELWPPDLKDWDLKREMARHDQHCLWIRRSLGFLWRLRRYPWGRVQALCGRNLDETPRLSIVKLTYVSFEALEASIARDFA